MSRAEARAAKRLADYVQGRTDGYAARGKPRRMSRAYWQGYQLGLQHSVEDILQGWAL